MLAALKGLPLYIIAGLLIALATTGVLLKGAWQGEAEAAALNDQWATAVDGYQLAITSLREERAAADALVAETEAARQAERERVSGLTVRLQEALRDDEDYQACRDVRLPAGGLDALDRMRADPTADKRAEH